MKVRTSTDCPVTGRTVSLAFISLALTLAACTLASCGPDPLPGTPVTSLTDSGAGSLREAIASAAAGDTLWMATAGTVTLSSPITVSKDLTILADGVTLDAGGLGRVLEVPADVTVTVKGGTLTGGVGQVLPATLGAERRVESLSRRFGPAQITEFPGSNLSAAALQPLTDPPLTYGGIIFNEGALTLDSVAVTGGKADIGAGIANTRGATLIIAGTASVTGNTAKESGAGIQNAGTITITGGSVSGNTSYYAGAGLLNDLGGAVTMSGGAIDNNTCTYPVTVDSSNNVTGCAGGGIYTNGDLTITGGSVSGNSASYFGGGITSQQMKDASGNLVVPKLTITGGTIKGNKLTDMTRGGGGGVWVNGTLTMTGGTIEGNTGVYGGGLGIQSDATITGGTIEGNTGLSGGGVFVYKPAAAAVTLNFGGSAVVKNNAATDSSGGLGVQTASLNMTGGRVMDNAATSGGGGIGFGGGSVSTISGGVISGNKVTAATGTGGGVRLFSSGATVTLSGGEVKSNTALKDGGGVLVANKAVLNMTGGSVTANSVTGTDQTIYQGFGGGVRLYAGATFNASGGTIGGNTAAQHGGGVFVGGPDTASNTPAGKFTMSGTTSITGNKATAGAGGGVVNGGTFFLQGGNITANSSAQAGGGVRNWKGTTFTQTGGSVTGNTPDQIQTDQ